MKKQTKKTAATPAKPTANAETVAPVAVRDIGKNCPPMAEGAMRAVRGLFQDAVDATRPPRSATPEEEAATPPGCSPEELTKAARAAALKDAARHKRNAERLASLAEVYNPGIQSDGATRRALLVEAGLLAPDASAAAERRRLAAIQEAIRKTPEAWQMFADEAKKEEALRDAALARVEKAGDVLRQLETDKRNAELAAAMREHAAALRDTAHAATPGAKSPADEKGAKGKPTGKQGKAQAQKPRVRKGMLDLAAEFMDVSRRQVQRYLDGSSPVPGEYRGFGYAVLESKDALENWILGLGLGERAAEFIARLADLAAKVGLGAPAPKRRERPPRYTPFDPSNDPHDPQAPNPFEEAANNIDGPPGEDENENW